MKQKQSGILVCLVVTALFFQYCSKNDTTGTTTATATTTESVTIIPAPQLPSSPFNYSNVVYPAHITAALASSDNTPANNPITNDGATLGRVLFYDKNLSQNNTISCGGCHRADLSFTDTAVKSLGFAGGSTARHSMRLLNVRFYKSGKMFWDERANTLEDQVLQPIQNTTEMGMTLDALQIKLSGISYYPSLFQKAFGTTDITSDKISKALAQFVRSIVTYQSKYDQVKEGLATFTADEQTGETLFLTAGTPCARCHTPPMFLNSAASPFALADPNDNLPAFKAGSLRNIVASVNYFHNGSIAGLQNVLGTNIPVHTVNPQDRPKILAFLQTLTDATTIADVKYSNPFK